MYVRKRRNRKEEEEKEEEEERKRKRKRGRGGKKREGVLLEKGDSDYHTYMYNFHAKQRL